MRWPTTPSGVGPGPLGLAVAPVGGVAPQSCHRPTGHRARLAPPRLPALLALAVHSEPGRPAAARRRDPPPHPPHGAGESDMGYPHGDLLITPGRNSGIPRASLPETAEQPPHVASVSCFRTLSPAARCTAIHGSRS